MKETFGLKNAPATFQQLIDHFRAGLKNVAILAYLDDLIILSGSFEKYVADLEEVFQLLRVLNLHLNRNECVFACPSVKYFGHIITPKGIQAYPGKISAIKMLAVPGN